MEYTTYVILAYSVTASALGVLVIHSVVSLIWAERKLKNLHDAPFL